MVCRQKGLLLCFPGCLAARLYCAGTAVATPLAGTAGMEKAAMNLFRMGGDGSTSYC